MYADDLKEDYSHELQDTSPMIWIPAECEFEVTIVHRTSGEEQWSGVVTAGSKRGAQQQFRKQYPHIRAQYSHAYGLRIRKL